MHDQRETHNMSKNLSKTYSGKWIGVNNQEEEYLKQYGGDETGSSTQLRKKMSTAQVSVRSKSRPKFEQKILLINQGTDDRRLTS